MESSAHQSQHFELDSRFKRVLLAFGFALPFIVWGLACAWCSLYELSCQTKFEEAQEKKSKKSDSDDAPFLIKMRAQPYQANAEGKAGESAACSFPCDVFKRTREDAVAFFTAVLVCVVWYQVMFMIRQEDWLRRGWKVGAMANSLSQGSLIIAADSARAAKLSSETLLATERAYIFCTGLFGESVVGNLPQSFPIMHDARSYGPPWNMKIHNLGKTPGYVTKVRYGVCKGTEFEKVKHLLVTEIIEGNKLPDVEINQVDRIEVFAPTEQPISYRHVHPDRQAGDVFFGRIDYADIFGHRHWSTFALLHNDKNTDTIGESFFKDNDAYGA